MAEFNQTHLGGAPTPDAYSALAREQHIGKGSTRAVALPSNMPGFVVGRSTLQGAPPDWDSKHVANIINIDPDVAGEGFTLDMSTISADAFNMAAHDAELGRALSIDDLRDKASSVYRQLAQVDPPPAAPQGVAIMQEGTIPGLSMPSTPPGASPLVPAAVAPMPTVANPVGAVKAASFAQPAVTQPVAPQPMAHSGVPVQPTVTAPMTPQQPAPSLFEQLTPQPARPAPRIPTHDTTAAAGGPPTYRLTFEIQDFPVSIEAWYHDVIRNDQVLVLIYDTRCVGYPRTQLQPTDKDIAVHIDGSDQIYVVQDPSINFTVDSQEFQVLLIKSTAPFGGAPELPAGDATTL